MGTQVGCHVCPSPNCIFLGKNGDRAGFECEVCGRYDISASALATKLNPNNYELTPVQRAVLSHRIREANDAGREVPLLTTYVVDDVIANGRLPTPAEQAANLIRFIGDRVSATGTPLRELPLSLPAAIGSPNRNFAMRIAKQLAQSGDLMAVDCGTLDAPDEIMEVDLTLAGWNEYDRERRGQLSPGRYGFLALQFGDATLDPFVQDVIKPAVKTLGFDLIDMRDAAEAGIIDNVMRARIRDASFVLVDLTHANKGAYWEAGYAEGLGKPVLYLCNREIFNEKGTHFDTNHCTTVLWDAANAEAFSDELTATLRRSLNLF